MRCVNNFTLFWRNSVSVVDESLKLLYS